jgi:hypothetical protein
MFGISKSVDEKMGKMSQQDAIALLGEFAVVKTKRRVRTVRKINEDSDLEFFNTCDTRVKNATRELYRQQIASEQDQFTNKVQILDGGSAEAGEYVNVEDVAGIIKIAQAQATQAELLKYDHQVSIADTMSYMGFALNRQARLAENRSVVRLSATDSDVQGCGVFVAPDNLVMPAHVLDALRELDGSLPQVLWAWTEDYHYDFLIQVECYSPESDFAMVAVDPGTVAAYGFTFSKVAASVPTVGTIVVPSHPDDADYNSTAAYPAEAFYLEDHLFSVEGVDHVLNPGDSGVPFHNEDGDLALMLLGASHNDGEMVFRRIPTPCQLYFEAVKFYVDRFNFQAKYEPYAKGKNKGGRRNYTSRDNGSSTADEESYGEDVRGRRWDREEEDDFVVAPALGRADRYGYANELAGGGFDTKRAKDFVNRHVRKQFSTETPDAPPTSLTPAPPALAPYDDQQVDAAIASLLPALTGSERDAMLVELGFDPSTYPGAGSHADQAPPGFEKAWPRMSEMSKAAVRARLSVSAQPKLPDHPPLPTMKQARAEITESTRRQAIEALKKSVSDIESAGYRLKDVVTLTADDMKNASALQIEELLLRKKLKKLNERRTIAEGLASKAKSMEMKAATAQKTMDELVKRLAATQLELEAITARHEAVMRGEDFEG